MQIEQIEIGPNLTAVLQGIGGVFSLLFVVWLLLGLPLPHWWGRTR